MTTTTHRPGPSVSDTQGDIDHHHGRRLAFLVAGLAVVTAAAVFSWSQLQDGSSPPAPVAVSGPDSPYGPGGSVYGEQVPGGAAVSGPDSPYGPGGSVYGEQVPGEAAVAGPDSPYAPGGSIYEEQVPTAAEGR